MTVKKQKDLFGNTVRQTTSKFEKIIKKFDSRTLQERVGRLKFISKYFPKNNIFVSSDLETGYIFDEAKMTFINGEYISTLILTQAFIERRIKRFFQFLGLDHLSTRGFEYMLKHANKYKLLNKALIRRLDKLRKRRNPYAHLKPSEHPHNIMNRIFLEKKLPLEIIENDAKESIKLMYLIAQIDLTKSH